MPATIDRASPSGPDEQEKRNEDFPEHAPHNAPGFGGDELRANAQDRPYRERVDRSLAEEFFVSGSSHAADKPRAVYGFSSLITLVERR